MTSKSYAHLLYGFPLSIEEVKQLRVDINKSHGWNLSKSDLERSDDLSRFIWINRDLSDAQVRVFQIGEQFFLGSPRSGAIAEIRGGYGCGLISLPEYDYLKPPQWDPALRTIYPSIPPSFHLAVDEWVAGTLGVLFYGKCIDRDDAEDFKRQLPRKLARKLRHYIKTDHAALYGLDRALTEGPFTIWQPKGSSDTECIAITESVHRDHQTEGFQMAGTQAWDQQIQRGCETFGIPWRSPQFRLLLTYF